MYEFVTHTFNIIKGKCPHDCSYCYMHRWGKQSELHFDEKELKTNLGKDNFIFVGSSCDMFAQDIPQLWIDETLQHCRKFDDNQYLFQTKNPNRLLQMTERFYFPTASVVCTTIETNRFIPEIMNQSPNPEHRADAMNKLYYSDFTTYVTIEPIMDFDLKEMLELVTSCHPTQVNIGADSGNNHLPEPDKYKLLEFMDELKKYITVVKKTNLNRLLNR